jgi:hypothetical protein
VGVCVWPGGGVGPPGRPSRALTDSEPELGGCQWPLCAHLGCHLPPPAALGNSPGEAGFVKRKSGPKALTVALAVRRASVRAAAGYGHARQKHSTWRASLRHAGAAPRWASRGKPLSIATPGTQCKVPRLRGCHSLNPKLKLNLKLKLNPGPE